MNEHPRAWAAMVTAIALAGCDDPASFGDGVAAGSAGTTGGTAGGTGGTAGGAGGSDAGTVVPGIRVDVPVAEGRPTYLSLSEARVVDVDDPGSSLAWDLSFRGYDVHTNGGASGPGSCRAFGPLPASDYLMGGPAPQVPFLTEDAPAGAFQRWYFYEGASHAVWSRFHRYAVRTAERTFLVQVLGYYGELAGAPVSALYTLRWRELAPGAPDAVLEEGLDATAGGPGGSPDVPSACLDLRTGRRLALRPAEAANSRDWSLCLRRTAITVNGEQGGPGEVAAGDLDADATEGETLAEVKARTPAATLAAFESVTTASVEGVELRGDRVVSAFDRVWLDRSTDPPGPAPGAFLVVGADGATRWMLLVTEFRGATAQAPGTVVLWIRRP